MKVISNKYTFPDDFERGIHKGTTSTVWISKDKMYIIKFVVKYDDYDVYKREVFMLDKLNTLNVEWCPKMVEYNDIHKYIVMTYCGEPITKTNKPFDTQKQLLNILEYLNEHCIKHNDIKESEILVHNNKIFLCDYGWCSLNGSWTMGINLNNCTKPCHNFKDETIFKRIPWLITNTYLNNNRKRVNGSQSESPGINIHNDIIHITGYQTYNISKNDYNIITNSKKLTRQLNILKMVEMGDTILDIGCSNGFFGFYYLLKSNIKCYNFMDHDKECISLIDTTVRQLHIPDAKYNLINQTFTEFVISNNSYETILALSIIHWLYSCTTTIGCLHSIIGYLRRKTTKTLVIEWIDITDHAIKSFKHINFNKENHTSEYSRINFESALKAHFSSYTCHKNSSLTGTRDIYVAYC